MENIQKKLARLATDLLVRRLQDFGISTKVMVKIGKYAFSSGPKTVKTNERQPVGRAKG